MSAHDRWLANYRTGTDEVWCSNPKCPNHADAVTVTWCSEYGQSWWEPEECWLCNQAWTDERPEPDDDDPDDPREERKGPGQ
jgi:hypothetical protein